jgi:hypothetical protein
LLPRVCRPRAGALVAALADPDRSWNAIVNGEYERALFGGQYAAMARAVSGASQYRLRRSLWPVRESTDEANTRSVRKINVFSAERARFYHPG